jgi:hypothetical protein
MAWRAEFESRLRSQPRKVNKINHLHAKSIGEPLSAYLRASCSVQAALDDVRN